MTEPIYTNRSYIGIVRTDVTLKAANRDVQRWDQLQTKATVRCGGVMGLVLYLDRMTGWLSQVFLGSQFFYIKTL